jgi:hypothetical protein
MGLIYLFYSTLLLTGQEEYFGNYLSRQAVQLYFVLQRIAAVFVALFVRRACDNYECYIELLKWTSNFQITGTGHPCPKAKRNVIPAQNMMAPGKRRGTVSLICILSI